MTDSDPTRAQEDAIERIALEVGGVAVREGYEDGHIEVTTLSGACHHIDEDGRVTRTAISHSIDWSTR